MPMPTDLSAYEDTQALAQKYRTLVLNEIKRRDASFYDQWCHVALNVDDILRAALKEDITSEDVSTNAVVTGPSQGSAQLIAKQDGVLAGLKGI